MSNLQDLSWAERFALIDALNPTDEQIIAAFEIDADELTTARELRDAGQFTEADEIDAEAFASVFTDVAIAEIETIEVTEQEPVVEAPVPVTATKTTATPKKRGRKGTKIAEAFEAIGESPVDANAFAAQYGVSLNVLRQAKRFDKTGLAGKVRVKKVDGTLSIYREAAAE